MSAKRQARASVHSLAFKRRCVFILDLCLYFVLSNTDLSCVYDIVRIHTRWVFGDDRSLLWGGEVVVMTASYVHTKQKLSQILLLCGMDQKNGVTSITKDKERWCWRIHNQHVYCVMLLGNVYGRYTATQSWETRAISGEITLIWQSTTETEGEESNNNHIWYHQR